MLLSGCTPALYIHLFNATGELITVSNTQRDQAITISVVASTCANGNGQVSPKTVVRLPFHQ